MRIIICFSFYHELKDFIWGIFVHFEQDPGKPYCLFAMFDYLAYLAASPSCLQMLLTCFPDSEALPSLLLLLEADFSYNLCLLG